MIAIAITQIHTHRRNRHGSWRDGEGGALDATRHTDPRMDGGADAAAPAESSKATTSRLGANPIAVSRTVQLEDGSSANASARCGT